MLIFDEAHNVEGVCSDASSFDITAKNLADAMQEARRYVWGEVWGKEGFCSHLVCDHLALLFSSTSPLPLLPLLQGLT